MCDASLPTFGVLHFHRARLQFAEDTEPASCGLGHRAPLLQAVTWSQQHCCLYSVEHVHR